MSCWNWTVSQNSIGNLSHRLTKSTKWRVPSEDSDQPGHPPSLIRVFAERFWGSLGPNPFSCGQWRLIRLGGRLGWFESSLGAQTILWFCHVQAHFKNLKSTYIVLGLPGLSKQCRHRSAWRSSLIRIYTVCHSACILWTHPQTHFVQILELLQ